jgi:hypothetical protein
MLMDIIAKRRGYGERGNPETGTGCHLESLVVAEGEVWTGHRINGHGPSRFFVCMGERRVWQLEVR